MMAVTMKINKAARRFMPQAYRRTVSMPDVMIRTNVRRTEGPGGLTAVVIVIVTAQIYKGVTIRSGESQSF